MLTQLVSQHELLRFLRPPRGVRKVARGRGAMSDVERLWLALAREPGDDTGWLALADCLEEAGEPRRAELVRLQLWLRGRLDDPQWDEWEQRLRQLWADGVV